MLHHNSRGQRTRGVLRFFIDCDGQGSAVLVAEVICDALPARLSAKVKSIQRYWKIPEWFEVVVEFVNEGSVTETLASVKHLAPVWQSNVLESGGYAIWSHEMGGTFVHEMVRWANIECFDG